MPFIGSINEKLRKYFGTHAKLLEGRNCYIGCSGNMSIEQILTQAAPGAKLYANDVSLYSCTLGNALMGRRLKLNVVNEELSWLQTYLDRGPAEAVSAMLLVMELLKFEKRGNPFAERMWLAGLTQWEVMFGKTVEKVNKAMSRIKIEEYTAIDVYDFYPRPGDVSIGFLPTYAGGYEKLFKRLEESIEWDIPPYAMLTSERREETVGRMTQGDYVLYDDRERDDLELVARMEMFGKKAVYIYSNLAFPKGLIRRKLNERAPKFRLLMPEDEIPAGAQVQVIEVDQPAIDHYRAMFLSKKIQPGSGGPCFVAFVGEKAFGFIIFQTYSKKGGSDRSSVYMLSDFVVPSHTHSRLAKLLLMVTLCKEMKQALESRTLTRSESIYTTAFTENAVSMKYRGLYELKKRGQDKNTKKKFLNYQGEFNGTSFKEVVDTWKKRFQQ